MKRCNRAGFTLIELLVVLAIMAIVATLAAPTVFGVVRGNKISQANQSLEGILALARRTAITKNHPVEVRFYRYAGKGNFASNVSFRALQAFEMPTSASFVALQKVHYFPDGIILDSGSTLSSIFDQTKRGTPITGSEALPTIGTNYTYLVLRFLPDGSTDLSSSQGPWFVTIHDETKGDALATPPANFLTVEADPLTGTLKYYRP